MKDITVLITAFTFQLRDGRVTGSLDKKFKLWKKKNFLFSGGEIFNELPSNISKR